MQTCITCGRRQKKLPIKFQFNKKLMVKLVKFKGPFVWHHHDNEDELFYVVKGNFDMEFRDKIITINEGEFIIVPRGVEHRPNAKEEVHVVLFEPGTTLNTGNVKNEMTLERLGRV